MEPCQWILRAEGIAESIRKTVAAKSYTRSTNPYYNSLIIVVRSCSLIHI